jgi:hypothetical protein
MADHGMTEPERKNGGAGTFLVKAAGFIIILILAGLLAIWAVQRYVSSRLTPDPTTIASASLAGLREQNRLSAFAARYVAVVTSKQSQFGFTSQKTLIMPGMVRYDVDMAKLTQADVAWNGTTRTLSVRLPAVEADAPQVDLNAVREYGSGGVLTTFTDAEKRLDAANRRAGQFELIRQAREPAMIKLARDATRRAVERSFAMPLRAAGIDATVAVRFADEPPPSTERWDTSRSLQDVLGNRP